MIIRNLFFYVQMSVFFTLSVALHGQSTYSLGQALTDAKTTAPASLIHVIVTNENALHQKNLKRKFLPQIGVSAQATYQSETTGLNLDIPGIMINQLSKDQYKATIDASQMLYDGGSLDAQKNIKNIQAASEIMSSELDLEQIREQIIQVYFGILEVKARVQILAYAQSDVDANLKKMQAAVDNGVVLKSQLKGLQAERLNIDVMQVELTSILSNQISILNILTGKELSDQTDFTLPEQVLVNADQLSSKPMLRMLDLQSLQLEQTRKLDLSLSRPKASLFVQGGYGKPGLNFLKDEFAPFYIGGVKIQWSLANLYTKGSDAQINTLAKQKVDVKKSAYIQQLSAKVTSAMSDIEKSTNMLQKDTEIIQLRSEIKAIAAIQLQNGSLGSSDYITFLNDENEAKINEALHRIQLIKAGYLLEHHNGSYLKNN